MVGCPNPIGYFTVVGDPDTQYPAACNSWACEVCGPKKLRRFLYALNHAAAEAVKGGWRWRGLTVTLSPEAKNSEIMTYWNRFRSSLKKAGYPFEYLWVKEFQKNGMLHLHCLVNAFIPWNMVKYYWYLATGKTSFIVKIANAQIQHTAAYLSKYLTKDTLTAPFRKGERRYGMSRAFRKFWPSFECEKDITEMINYEFTFKPDNSNLNREGREYMEKRQEWLKSGDLRLDRGKHRVKTKYAVKGRKFVPRKYITERER